ncbi:aminotransferase class IV [Mangrovibacterium sp.]|uniref:aminotransferase class IV n=1 Tax=Mangrovibacterium sp. TaxID=1961364 RepID=UPI003564AA45
MSYILFNGTFHPPEGKLFSPQTLNELLFRDKLKMIKSKLLFWDEHLNLWQLHFQLFRIALPDFIANNGKELRRQIERCLVKNKCYKSAQIQLTFFNTGKTISYLIELEPEADSAYPFDADGYSVQLFHQIYKSDSPLSSLSTGSETLWEIARTAIPGRKEIPIIMDRNQNLLEVPGANLFLVRENQLLTPNRDEGTYINPAKRVVGQIAQKIQMDFDETNTIREDDLRQADEVFVADDIRGIRFIRAFGMKRYYKKTTSSIAEEFNRLLVQ